MSAVLLVAAAAPSPSPSASASSTVSAALAQKVASGNLGPGWVAFAFVVGIGVALFLLMRSMRRQFKKIDFVEEPDPRTAGGAAATNWPTRPPEAPPAPRRGR